MSRPSINIAWLTKLYDSPGGPDDDRPDQADLARGDVDRDPAWQEWFTHLEGHDPFLMIKVVDDPPRRRVTSGYSKRDNEHSVTVHVAVHELLQRDERTVIREAIRELFVAVAAKLELPAPPPTGREAA